jgi:transcriptional regulator with XRE-family HTH domain
MEANELVTALRALGLSQKEIGEACGLSQGAISHIETGRSKSVLIDTHRKLEALLGAKAATVASS